MYNDFQRSIKLGLIILMVMLSGCLKARDAASLTANSSAWFTGATTAKNLGGYPSAIKVSWAAADRSVLGYNVYSLRAGASGSNEWVLVGSVDPTQTSFTDSDSLSEGQIYTYKVLAIDATTNVEDGNTKQVSTVTFYGVGGVTITGKTTASITLNGSTGAFDAIHIYATPKNGNGTPALVAKAVGNVQNIDVTGLRSGVNYKFSARAYMSYLGAEDGNDSTILGQTYSDSFGSGKDNDTSFYYRGILNFQGYGRAPNATSGPTARQFRITWLPFSNANSTTKYRVVRSTTTAIDMTAATACTSTSTSSCKVCEVTGTQYCEDSALAAPPQTYYYSISLVKTDSNNEQYVEELPCQNSADCSNRALYTVKAHVPSDYMVLVQRDAANYEMCMNINASSDPRHNQRCAYTGLGATPNTTGPTKPVKNYDSGYYDFGYNMLVDRYKLACNWTRTVNDCSTPNSTGAGLGCIGVVNSAATTNITASMPASKADGRVFLGFSNHINNGDCFIDTVNLNNNAGWFSVNNSATSLSLTDLATATTLDPGEAGKKQRPPIHRVTPEGAARICSAHGSDYGSKRLLRRREYLVASPLPYIPGEPNSISTSLTVFEAPNIAACNPGISTLASGTTGDAAIVNYLNGTSVTTALDYQGTVLNHYNYGERYFIGNNQTSTCVSRFGIQDPYTFYAPGIIFSDTFARSNFGVYPPIMTGTVGSDLDIGNTDFAGFSFNGNLAPNTGFAGQFGRYIWIANMPTHTTFFGCQASTQNRMTSMIMPLGAPICNWTGGPQTLRNINELTSSGKLGYAYIGAGGRATARFQADSSDYNAYVMSSEADSAGRWGFTLMGSTGVNASGVLCGVEAE